MPDNENLLNTQELEDSVSIDNLTQSPDLDGDDVIVMVHENNGVKSTYKAILRSIANFINKLLHYSTDLHTQNDTIIGAINELADGGGGSADIISSASGSIATFNDGGNNIPVKSLVTDITATQAGTGTPAPDNIRAITGFDEIKVTVIGKNFYPINVGRDLFADNRGASHTTNNDILSITMTSENNSGAYGGTGTAVNNVICQTIKKYSGEFVLSLYAKASADNKDVYFGFGSFGYVIESLTTEWKRIELPLTLDGEIHTLTFYNRSSTAITVDVKDLQIELGTTATDYAEYNSKSTEYTINLPETIYKCEADIVNGKGSKSFNAVDLGDLTYTYDSTYTRMWADISGLKAIGNVRQTPFVCSCFQSIDDGRAMADVPYNSVYAGAAGTTRVYFKTTETDPAAFKTAVTGQTLVYPIEDTAISFTPESIPTLSGLNNIFSNTDDVEVEYFNENADQTADLIRVMTYMSSPETISLTLTCPRTQTSNLQYEVYNHTIMRNCRMSIQTSGLTDCGSNDAYLALLVNGVEIQRGTLITDTTTKIDFSPVDLNQGDTVRLIFGWANNHGASFSGEGKMVLF